MGEVGVDKVALLIDGGYLEKTLKNEFGQPRIDYSKLSDRMGSHVPDSTVIRTYYFHCLPHKGNPPTQEENERFAKRQQFYEYLRGLPRWEVRMGYLAKRSESNGKVIYEQKQVDMLLGLTAVHLSAKSQISHIGILAGDSDYIPAIRMAKDDGVDIFLFHGQAPHNELVKAADVRIRIDQSFIDSVLLH